MAVTRQANLLSQQRLDIPHLRALESSVASDFDVLAGRAWGGQGQLVVRGFTLGNIAVNTPAVSLQLATADGIAFNSQATEAGTMLWVPADRAVETLNPVSNSKIDGGWTPSATNYVGIDFVRATDATTTDLVQFLDAVTKLETPKQVPLARTLDYRIVIGTVPFSGQPNLVPIAKVTLNGSSQVTAVEDARPLMFRLGIGGDSPNKYGFFGGWTRKENFGTLDSTLFTGGDKGIGGLKAWQDAVMTRLWEVGGGEFWYSATADRNVHMVTAGVAMPNGDYWTWTLGTQTLQWQGIMLLFDNSTAYRADVNNGSISPLLPGECLYVDLDRTKFYVPAWLISTGYVVGDLVVNGGNAYECTVAGTSAGAGGPTGTGGAIVDGTVTWKYVGPGQAGGLTMQKGALLTLGPGVTPGSRWILAWRRGSDVFSRDWRYPVGTLFVPATTLAQGVVKISRDYTGLDTPGVSALNDPIALSDRGGLITVPAVGNVGLRIKRFDAGADIIRWDTAAGVRLGYISNAGDLSWQTNPRKVEWPSGFINMSTGGTQPMVFSASGNLVTLELELFSAFAPRLKLDGGARGIIIRHDATSAGSLIEGYGPTAPETAITFRTGSAPADRWKVTETGVLTSVGGPRAIQSVLDPVTAQDAVTKLYADNMLHGGNLIINGNFDFWQRGAAIKTIAGTNQTVTHVALANVYNMRYGADRWYGEVSNVVTGGSGSTVEVTRQASGLTTSPWCARVTQTGDGNTLAGFTQEIDRDLVAQLRGKTLTVQFKIRANATHIASGGNTQIRISSGNDAGGNVVRRNYAGLTAVLGVQIISNASLTGSFQTFTYTGGTPVPSDSTELAFNISMGGGGGAYIEVAEVIIVPQTAAVPISFVRAGGTWAEEFQLCQRYYEKSYEADTAPGTLTTPHKDGSHVAFWPSQIATVFGFPIPIGYHPRYKVYKWRPDLDGITTTLYRRDVADTVGSWFITGGFVQAVTAVGGNGQRGFIIFADAALAAVGAVTDLRTIDGHWASSADIGDVA